MKKIEAIIRPEKLMEVKRKLSENGFPALTTYDVRGTGKEQGLTMRALDGSEIKVELLPKQKIELVLNDDDLEKALEIILEESKTGQIGDGKIFITTVEEVITVRTGERGAKI